MSSETTPGRPKRADARRNVDAILEAAIRELASSPDASLAEIAAAAGVGRVTIYAHFTSREDLVRQAVGRVIAEGELALGEVDLTGDVREALGRLIQSGWQQVVRIGSLMTAAIDVLSAVEIRELHDAPAARVQALIRRGREEGAFRRDLPEAWLVSVVHMVMQGASVEVSAGRLKDDAAAKTITTTVLAALAA